MFIYFSRLRKNIDFTEIFAVFPPPPSCRVDYIKQVIIFFISTVFVCLLERRSATCYELTQTSDDDRQTLQ